MEERIKLAVRATVLSLMLCGSALAGGPLWSCWYIDQIGMGHRLKWQQEQIDAGLPVMRSFRMTQSIDRNKTQAVTYLNTVDAPWLAKMNGHPVAMRMNNITGEIDKTIPRVRPLDEQTWRNSHMCVTLNADGTYNDTPQPSPFAGEAGIAAWTATGVAWSPQGSAWMAGLQQIITDPADVILRENNEGPRVQFKDLYVREGVRFRNPSGSVGWAEPSTPVAWYTYPDPATPGITYQNEPGGGANNSIQVFAYYWKSDAELSKIDLRAPEWVAPRRGTMPLDSQGDFAAMERALYQALYSAFESSSGPGWHGKLRTVGYGDYAENRQNDAASPAFYLGFYRDPDLTKPGAYSVNRWDSGEELEAENANPDSWREYSICVGNPASAIYKAHVATPSRHGVVSPSSAAGIVSHLVWRMQSPGKMVVLTEWDNAAATPQHLIFSDKTNSPILKPDHIAALTAIGRQDMLALTLGDYEGAILRALARIHHDPFLSKCWEEGTTRLLSSPLNTTTATKVYATETTIPGDARTMVCVYTPCELNTLPAEIDVGAYRVPASEFEYWIASPPLIRIP